MGSPGGGVGGEGTSLVNVAGDLLADLQADGELLRGGAL